MAYICRKGCECHGCDSFRYDDERMEKVCFGKYDEQKAYEEKDYRKLIDLSGLKPEIIADKLKMPRSTFSEKIAGKRTFSNSEEKLLETVLLLGRAIK